MTSLSFKKINNETLSELPKVIIGATLINCIIKCKATFNRCILKNCTFEVKPEIIGCEVTACKGL